MEANFINICSRVEHVFRAAGGQADLTHTIALAQALNLQTLHQAPFNSFIIVDQSTNIPYHHLSIAGHRVIISKGVHERTSHPQPLSHYQAFDPHKFQSRSHFLMANQLVADPIFGPLYANDILHKVDSLLGFIRIQLLVVRPGYDAVVPSCVCPQPHAFRQPDVYDWACFNLLATADLSLPASPPPALLTAFHWIAQGDEDYYRDQQLIDPIIYDNVCLSTDEEYKSVSAMLIAAATYMRMESTWLQQGVKGYRENVAVRDRCSQADIIPGFRIMGDSFAVTVVAYTSWFVAVVTLLNIILHIVLISTVNHKVLSIVILAASIILFIGKMCQFNFRPSNGMGVGFFRKVKVRTVKEAANVLGKHPSAVWTSLAELCFRKGPSALHLLKPLWSTRSRLSDWLDAGAKTVVTREGRLALLLSENILVMLRDEDEMVVQERAFDEWHERHFSYRKYIGQGEGDMDMTLTYYSKDSGAAHYDDNVCHLPMRWWRRGRGLFYRTLGAWRRSRLFESLYRPAECSEYGLPTRDVGIRGVQNEARYIERVLDSGQIPAVLPTRLDMEVSTEVMRVLSSEFSIEEVGSENAYEELFDFDTVEEVFSEAVSKDVLCLAISYKHHVGGFSNRMPREVWSREVPHIEELMKFYCVTRIRFWTDTRVSKLRHGSRDDWEQVGLAPYGQMAVYIVNSHLADTLVDRFWLTAERKLGSAVGGVHYTGDDGKLTTVVSDLDGYVDPDVLSALFGAISSSSVFGEVYRADKLRVVERSIRKLECAVGNDWKRVIVNLPWALTLFDFSHDVEFGTGPFDETEAGKNAHWQPSADVMISRRILNEIGEENSFPDCDDHVEVELYMRNGVSDRVLCVLKRESGEVAAMDVRAVEDSSTTPSRYRVIAVGKGRLVGIEFVSSLEEQGFVRVHLDLY